MRSVTGSTRSLLPLPASSADWCDGQQKEPPEQMGTNFYWRLGMENSPVPGDDDWDSMDIRVHIGKRSAAGQYCWDCDVTLCKGGNAEIHMGRTEWWNACPKCGSLPVPHDGFSSGPAAVELGFAKPRVERPTGVRGTSSFSWAQDPERVGAICEQRSGELVVVNEYGDTMTGRDFLDMLLANCAVQYLDMVGREFS